MPPLPATPSSPLDLIQAKFLAALPAIERRARFAFRDVRCWHRKEEAVQEAVALCWCWFRRLIEKGKDPSAFPVTLAGFASRQVKCGRGVCGKERIKDALSPSAQQQRGFTVSPIPSFSTLSDNPLQEALIDNTQSPVPDQVIFRLDFPAWLLTLSDRDSRIVEEMMLGAKTSDLAEKFKVSPARISQLRRELFQSWSTFSGESGERPGTDGSHRPDAHRGGPPQPGRPGTPQQPGLGRHLDHRRRQTLPAGSRRVGVRHRDRRRRRKSRRRKK